MYWKKIIVCIFIFMVALIFSSYNWASKYLSPTTVNTASDWPTKKWSRSNPEQQGMDDTVLSKLDKYIEDSNGEIRSMLVVRNGFIVKESQTVISKTNEKQLIYSVTKSVLSALYGIAVSEGKIGLDERVLDILGERSIVDEAAKDKITIRHLLTMTSGLNWPELAGNYYGPESVSRQMMRSQNWVQFILKRPMRIEPGISYNYSSADSHLLSAVLQARTGQTVYDYAKTKLFEPLGIHNTQWDQDPQGITSGHSGLYLTPLDMAKFGYLYLHQGTWDGKQVVPQNWIMESTTVHSGGDYGYQWRVDEAGNWVARGFAGQYIFVSPKTNIVAVFTGVLPANKESVPIYLFSDYILKSVINQNN